MSGRVVDLDRAASSRLLRVTDPLRVVTRVRSLSRVVARVSGRVVDLDRVTVRFRSDAGCLSAVVLRLRDAVDRLVDLLRSTAGVPERLERLVVARCRGVRLGVLLRAPVVERERVACEVRLPAVPDLDFSGRSTRLLAVDLVLDLLEERCWAMVTSADSRIINAATSTEIVMCREMSSLCLMSDLHWVIKGS